MPSTTEGLYNDSRQEFCRALKAARESRGISLDAISEATKVASSYFIALERGDISRWPTGIFRRSFFRDYVRAIGLPMGETCDAFVRAFPDAEHGLPGKTESKPEPGATPVATAPAEEVRLAFDPAWHGPRAPLLSRLFATAIDAAVVLAAAVAAAWAAGVDTSTAAAVGSVAYFSLSTLCLGHTPAAWAIAHRHVLPQVLALGMGAIAGVWKRRSDVMTNVFGKPTADTAPPTDQGSERRWVTDARRVGPPQLRVRIKVPQ